MRLGTNEDAGRTYKPGGENVINNEPGKWGEGLSTAVNEPNS